MDKRILCERPHFVVNRGNIKPMFLIFTRQTLFRQAVFAFELCFDDRPTSSYQPSLTVVFMTIPQPINFAPSPYLCCFWGYFSKDFNYLQFYSPVCIACWESSQFVVRYLVSEVIRQIEGKSLTRSGRHKINELCLKNDPVSLRVPPFIIDI